MNVNRQSIIYSRFFVLLNKTTEKPCAEHHESHRNILMTSDEEAGTGGFAHQVNKSL